MRRKLSSSDRDGDAIEVTYGESTIEATAGRGTRDYPDERGKARDPHDERKLYGEPRHEIGSTRSEKHLYGEPQHETREGSDLPDVELLFARLELESLPGPTVLPAGSESRTDRLRGR